MHDLKHETIKVITGEPNIDEWSGRSYINIAMHTVSIYI